MRAQSPVGAKIPATMTVRTAIEVAVLCITSLKLYLKLDEMHKLVQRQRRVERRQRAIAISNRFHRN
jgi:hypothetical protein